MATVLAAPALLTPEAFTRLLQPLRVLHAEWIDLRLARLTDSLSRFRETPAALATCFAGAIVVQAVLVAFYLAIARSMRIPVGFAELALVVPISFIVQMLPVSMNGFGVREATFAFYFSRFGLPARVGHPRLLRRRGGHHAVFAVGRGGLPGPPARRRRPPRQHLISLTAANSGPYSS